MFIRAGRDFVSAYSFVAPFCDWAIGGFDSGRWPTQARLWLEWGSGRRAIFASVQTLLTFAPPHTQNSRPGSYRRGLCTSTPVDTDTTAGSSSLPWRGLHHL